MIRKMRIAGILVALLLFCGCDMRTVDEMFALPERPASDYNLEQAIYHAMSGLEYSAPKTGENQQIVQTADLDGNGEVEYLLFAKGEDEHPLKILIFDKLKDSYNHVDTISCNGYAFDRVEYAQIDGNPGYEIVVGSQLNGELTRNVSIYAFRVGQSAQLLNTNYSQLIVGDLDADHLEEVFIIRPGSLDTDKGVVSLYGMENGVMERSVERNLSAPAERVKRILISNLEEGHRAVYVASAIGDSTLITDVYALRSDTLTNVSLSLDVGTSVQTMRNYYVYADDIDEDGVMELPSLVDMVSVTASTNASLNKLIRWYSMDIFGQEIDKCYTYHNFVDGWFLDIQPEWVDFLAIARQDNEIDFFVWDMQNRVPIRLFSIAALTGQNREEMSQKDGRFILYQSDSIIYCGEITATGENYEITQQGLCDGFHLIWQDWNHEGI